MVGVHLVDWPQGMNPTSNPSADNLSKISWKKNTLCMDWVEKKETMTGFYRHPLKKHMLVLGHKRICDRTNVFYMTGPAPAQPSSW